MQEILQYLFSGITSGAIYAVIALGFSMLYNSTDLINFAHGEFVMLGGLTLVTLWSGAGLPLPVALLATVAVVASAGAAFQRLAIATVKNPDPIVLVIITVGASILLRGVAMIVWGKDPRSVPFFSDHGPIDIAGAKLLPQSVWIFVIAAAIIVALHFFFKFTLVGKAMEACAVSRRAAWLTGIPAGRMNLLAFILSTGSGAVAGAIIAPITMCGYDMGTMLGLKGFCAAMLGGLGNLWGALAGGLLLGILEAAGVGLFSSGYKDAIAFVLLLLILYMKPSGLLGSAKVQRF